MTRRLHSRAHNGARGRRLLALFGSTALAVSGLTAGAAKANDIWNGTGSNDWFTAGNWTPNAVPIATDNVFIGVILPNPTTINAAGAVAFNLSIGDPTGGNSGALTITGAGGLAVSQNSFIGKTAGTSGVVTVTGAGASWNTVSSVFIGDVGNGQVSLLSGGHIIAGGGAIGDFAGSVGVLTIDGAGSLWTSTGNVSVGNSGQGTLTITNGGQMMADQTYAGGSTTSVITVDGMGSQLTDNTTLQIGNTGVGGQLNITSGGAVTTTNAAIGAGAAGQANVTGAGSAFTVTNDLSIGTGSTLTVSGGAALSVAINGTGVTGTGVINIGAGVGSAAAAPGAYTTSGLFLGAAASTIVFNDTSAGYVFAGPIQGSGKVDQEAGVTHLTGSSQFFAGSAVVNGGTLFVDNSFGGTISVASGGTLGGNSSSFVLGAVSVASGGTLVGAQGATFTPAAALTLASGSILNVTLGAPGSVTPLFAVGANLTLDGTLNITNAAGFGPGLYRLITYAGALTDNTLDIGTVPGGTTAAQYAVQTGTVHQVNLLYSGIAPPPPPPPPPPSQPPAPPAPTGPFSLWNVGASVAGAVTTGGTGVWSANSATFANAAGTANAPLTASPGFPIFAGTAGVVTVDLSAGPVQISGLQLATSNYLITGGAIGLNPGVNTFRVGDGTAAGAGFVGSIASSLTGAGGLDKNDLGTLILSGANGYTGATRVSAGALVLADGGSIAASSGLTDNATFDISGAASGASLASLSGAGVVVLGSQTLTLTAASGDFSGAIGGAGGLSVSGGAQVLSGANSFTGGVSISAGASLALGNGGASGAVVGPVTDNGALILNRSDAVTVSSAISGAGGVTQAGSGMTTLAGLNTYAGGTTISAGGLAGSATSFGSGAILDNAALTITQATDAAMGNRLDGSGVFTKTGSGGLSLTGGGGLTGGIALAAGRLSIDSDFSHTPVTVNAGVLAGIGAIGALTVNGGVVQPGDAPSSAGQATVRSSANAASGARASAALSGIGSLTVAGDYNQASGAILRLQVGSTAASQLTVTGVATLAPGAILQLTPVGGGPYTIGARMLAFSAAGGMQGRFTLDAGGPVSPFLGFTASYVGDDVFLSLTKLSSFAAAGATLNQRAAAAGADSLTATQPVTIALAGLQSDAVAQGAFDQLSGEAHASAITTEFEDSRFLRDAVSDRMGEGVSRTGSAWAKVIGAWGTTGSDGNAARLTRSSAGLMFGADRALSDTWRAGVIGGYARTQETVADRSSSATAQNLSVGGYVGGRFERLTLSAGLSQTWTSLDTSRTVAFPGFAGRVTGGPGLDASQAFGEAAYSLNLPRQQAQVFGDLAAVNVHSQSGQEDGGPAALTIHGKDQAVAFATLGLKDSVRLNAQGLTAEATLAWRHAQGDVTPTSTQSFSGGSDFTVQGAPIGRDALVLKAALGGEIAPRLAVQLGYAGQFSRSAADQDVKLNLSLRF